MILFMMSLFGWQRSLKIVSGTSPFHCISLWAGWEIAPKKRVQSAPKLGDKPKDLFWKWCNGLTLFLESLHVQRLLYIYTVYTICVVYKILFQNYIYIYIHLYITQEYMCVMSLFPNQWISDLFPCTSARTCRCFPQVQSANCVP